MNNDVAKNSTQSDAIEFLPAALEVLEKPPAPFGRIIAVVIGLFFVFAVVWAYWGTVDIVVIAEGQTLPTGKVKTVQPLETGVIRAIHIQDGQLVEKNQLLIELDPTETSANLESIQFELMQARIEAALGAAMLTLNPNGKLTLPQEASEELLINSRILLRDTVNRFHSSLDAIKSEINRSEASLRAAAIERRQLGQTIPLVSERLEAQEILLAKGITQKPMVLQLKQQKLEMEAQLEGVFEKEAEAQATIATWHARESETRATYRSEAANRRQKALSQITVLEQNYKKELKRQSYRELRAPVSGYIDKLAVHTIGAVVETGKQLLTIVPSDTPLEIEAIVLNKDIGFLEVGQEAEIKLEAFPFTRYGVLAGTVSALSYDVFMHEQLGPIYKAKVKLETQSITVDGRTIDLAPGMRVTAEVKTGKRRIIEFFLSPLLRYKQEAIRER